MTGAAGAGGRLGNSFVVEISMTKENVMCSLLTVEDSFESIYT